MYWIFCEYEKTMRVFMGVNGYDKVRCVGCNQEYARPRIDTENLTQTEQRLEEACYRLERSGQPFVAQRIQHALAGDGVSRETAQAWMEERARRLKIKYPLIDGPEETRGEQ